MKKFQIRKSANWKFADKTFENKTISLERSWNSIISNIFEAVVYQKWNCRIRFYFYIRELKYLKMVILRNSSFKNLEKNNRLFLIFLNKKKKYNQLEEQQFLRWNNPEYLRSFKNYRILKQNCFNFWKFASNLLTIVTNQNFVYWTMKYRFFYFQHRSKYHIVLAP